MPFEKQESKDFSSASPLGPDTLKIHSFKITVPNRKEPNKEMTFLIKGRIDCAALTTALKTGEGSEDLKWYVVDKKKGKIYELGQETVLAYVKESAYDQGKTPKVVEVKIKPKPPAQEQPPVQKQPPVSTVKPLEIREYTTIAATLGRPKDKEAPLPKDEVKTPVTGTQYVAQTSKPPKPIETDTGDIALYGNPKTKKPPQYVAQTSKPPKPIETDTGDIALYGNPKKRRRGEEPPG